MKYYLLKELVSYLRDKVHNIKHIKRIDNNLIVIEFDDKNILYFDMTRGKSQVYKRRVNIGAKRDFHAPFDVVLQKRFINSKVENIQLYNNDKIINIIAKSTSSYKKLNSILQLEFTGRYTNIIILDKNRVIVEALRHIDELSSSRIVKAGIKLSEIPKQSFTPKIEKINNIEKYLYDVYEKVQTKNILNYKKQKISQIEKKLEKLEKIIKTLPKKEELEKKSKELYEEASLILNNLHQIKPYQNSFKTYNYKGEEIEIKLDTTTPPSIYSNELFKKARKAKHKAININIEKDNLEEKTIFLKRLISNLKNSNSIDEIEFLSPKKEKNQIKTKKSQMYESFFFEGYKIMLGSNERENIYLLQNSKSSDFWFHLKNSPSCHVIVKTRKKNLPQNVIEKAATICVKFSTDFQGSYRVDYTQRRNVKIQNGANVLYNPYTSINIKS